MVPDDPKLTYELSFRDVIRILQLVDETPFQELRLELADLKVHLVRDGHGAWAEAAPAAVATAAAPAAPPAAPAAVATPATPAATPATPPAAASDGETPGGTPVTAPMAGVFYRAPAPGKPPFVTVGSTVQAGDVVGIIEVMKLMNHIKAPCAGVITAIHAQNEQFVEFGQVLAVIAPPGAAEPD